MKTVFVLLALALVAVRAEAQAVTTYTVTIYAAGTNTVIGTPSVIPAASFVCNQPSPAGVTVNPNKVLFADPVNAGQVCLYTDPGTGPLGSLPLGAAQYEATVIATNNVGSSAESARALPFTHPGAVPAVLTGVRVIR